MAAHAQYTVGRFRTFLQEERESATLYTVLAEAEPSPQLAAVYRALAETERRHAAFWEARLRQAGASVPAYSPGWRVRIAELHHGAIWAESTPGDGSTFHVLPLLTPPEQ